MTREQQEVLTFFNSNRIADEQVTLEAAKGMYIPDKRLVLESRFPKQLVDDVFGKATWLEQAEMQLLKSKNPDSVRDCERFVTCAICISHACADTKKKELEKYKHLEVNIPIKLMLLENSQFEQCDVKVITSCLTIYQIQSLGEYLKMYAGIRKYDVRCSYYRHILEAVEISLMEVVEKLKKEIIG